MRTTAELYSQGGQGNLLKTLPQSEDEEEYTMSFHLLLLNVAVQQYSKTMNVCDL